LATYKASLIEFPVVAGLTILVLMFILLVTAILKSISPIFLRVYLPLKNKLFWQVPIRLI